MGMGIRCYRLSLTVKSPTSKRTTFQCLSPRVQPAHTHNYSSTSNPKEYSTDTSILPTLTNTPLRTSIYNFLQDLKPNSTIHMQWVLVVYELVGPIIIILTRFTILLSLQYLNPLIILMKTIPKSD